MIHRPYLLHLTEANLTELLQNAGKVHIPQMVDIEMADLYPHWTKQKPELIPTEALDMLSATSLWVSKDIMVQAIKNNI